MIRDARYDTNAMQREHIRGRVMTGTVATAVLAAAVLTVTTGPVVALTAVTLVAAAVTVRQLVRTRRSPAADTPAERDDRGTEPTTAD